MIRKKNEKSKSWKKIRHSLKRIAAPFFVVVFFAGLMRMGGTNARFLDEDKSGEISVSMGAVNFSLESAADFSGAVTASQSASRDIELKDNRTLDFQYKIKSTNFSGDLCDYLKLKVKFDGGSDLYSESLKTFSYAVGNFSNPEKLKFTAEINGSDTGLEGKKCNFDLEFEAWQKSITNFEDGGFSDEEILSNSVKSAKEMVLNEIFPNPSGTDNSDISHSEFIELYNNSNSSRNLDGWRIYFEDSSYIEINATTTSGHNTTIEGQNLAVVFFFNNGWTSSKLNNTNGTISLYSGPKGSSDLMDSYSYSSGSEGKSFVRQPTGIGDWIKANPTPGS